MKVIFAFAAIVCVAVAAPQTDRNADANAVVTKLEQDNIGVGGYSFGYDTSNGIAAQETGQLQNAGSENEAIAVQGQYSYIDASGQRYTIKYIADENGFQPQGDHIPQ